MGDFLKRIKITDLIGMIFAFVIFAFIIFGLVMVLGTFVAEFHVSFWYLILAIIIITATIDWSIEGKSFHASIKLNDTMVRSWKESKFLNWPIGIMTFFTLLSLTVIGLELSGACIPELLGQDPREIAVWNHPNCG